MGFFSKLSSFTTKQKAPRLQADESCKVRGFEDNLEDDYKEFLLKHAEEGNAIASKSELAPSCLWGFDPSACLFLDTEKPICYTAGAFVGSMTDVYQNMLVEALEDAETGRVSLNKAKIYVDDLLTDSRDIKNALKVASGKDLDEIKDYVTETLFRRTSLPEELGTDNFEEVNNLEKGKLLNGTVFFGEDGISAVVLQYEDNPRLAWLADENNYGKTIPDLPQKRTLTRFVYLTEAERNKLSSFYKGAVQRYYKMSFDSMRDAICYKTTEKVADCIESVIFKKPIGIRTVRTNKNGIVSEQKAVTFPITFMNFKTYIAAVGPSSGQNSALTKLQREFEGVKKELFQKGASVQFSDPSWLDDVSDEDLDLLDDTVQGVQVRDDVNFYLTICENGDAVMYFAKDANESVEKHEIIYLPPAKQKAFRRILEHNLNQKIDQIVAFTWGEYELQQAIKENEIPSPASTAFKRETKTSDTSPFRESFSLEQA